MFTFRLASLFLLSIATIASTGPVANAAGVNAVGKRASDADVNAVFTNLQSSTSSILPQIDALVSGGTASDATVTPLINELTAALNTATASLAALPAGSVAKRQTEADIAIVIAGIVTDITRTLNGLIGEAAHIPELTVLLVGVDVALNKVLVGVELLLAGVLKLVAGLLVDVAGLLDGISFGLVLATLGL